MTAASFIALRDSGTVLWTDIEAHRLGLEKRIKRKSHQDKYLRIVTAFAGVVAGASGVGGADVFGSGGWNTELAGIAGIAGIVAALCVALNPLFKLSEEIEKDTKKSQELKALQVKISDQITRMQTKSAFTVEDGPHYVDKRRSDFEALKTSDSSPDNGFKAAAAVARDKYNFPHFEYIGQDQIDELESIQEPSDDLVAFGLEVNP